MKTIKYFVIISLVVLVFLQLYWRLTYGFLSIYIQNQDTSLSSYTISVGIDERVLEEYQFKSSDIISHEILRDFNFSDSTLFIKREDTGLVKKISADNFIVKWIVVDITDKEMVVHNHYFPPLLQ